VRKLASFFLLVFSITMLAQAQQESITDAAKTKPVKKARKIITNDDIPSRPEPEPEAKSEAAAPSSPTAEDSKSDTNKDDAKKDPDAAEESESVKAAQKKVDELKARLGSIQQQIVDTNKKLEETTDDQVRDALTSARDGKTEFAEDLKKQLSAAEKELEAATGDPAKESAANNELKPSSEQQ
jgi:hypothetical protein